MIQKHILSIGGLAQAAGVNVETVRYYQRVGMLAQPAKPLHGIRKYGVGDVKRIRFIKRAQLLGFTLAEVSELLVLSNASSCRETQDLAESKLKSVSERIRDLTKMQDTLLQLVARCNAADDSTSCPIIDALVGED
ncbi:MULTISPECIES: Hg(II)-responsive transcriptional regulator [unclassified Limnobacter]|jgi:MerR family mercuric resistance operon transcriptional regulator|uniref:Hg(II)-responsive transcriptional regulator n=1 Tax=unclassified Limnobacter TaxID=2630203 RepID=UPI000156C209|nr:transcriptional regulator, MerR family protein [Limnobacter sp. MED105]PZO19099.1 MAG: Hg(II)-responsive transcriptional regulator [Betaproteobacteria bacterium]PZO25039.1 MAG: Hg(II)-responsive transcriptional regulator [Betaproteobacteria bacterium]PZO32129.1 MAG: Hg(II)-responsive transcriptional regulator [Betaproteobacteria bacterium]